MDAGIVTEAEQLVRALAADLTRSGPGECLICYLHRVLGQFGCDHTHRFTGAFRDERMARATALESRLRGAGAYCDCEVLWNAVRPAVDMPEDAPLPSCLGIRAATTRPCGLWRARRW